jgi:hypothetical protein
MALALGAPLAHAAFHLFRIEQLYTNADGTVQFVVLREAAGVNGENLWAGQRLLATNSAGAQTAFAFPSHLPSANTANRRVLVATPAFASLGLVTHDYTIPANFLPISGGTLNYAGVHQITFGPLPTDGSNALLATGAVAPNVATNFAGLSASVPATPAAAAAIEFYNASLDHYFLTHIVNEIGILDAGVQIRGWTRTGQSFQVYAAAGTGTSPVCRFYIPPDKGNSHFYGRGTAECDATGTKNPSFINEDPQFFHVVLPAAGTCPSATTPVYRVFSNRADANHRYMIDRGIRDAMVRGQRWLAEGDGPDLVVMCVPVLASPESNPAPVPMPPPELSPPPERSPPGSPYYP